MTALAATLTVLTALVGLVWASRHIKIALEHRTGFSLKADYAPTPDPAPRISILVAAKDEQDNIETCVRSLAASDYPNFEIIVINDRSEDRTGEIADRLATEDDRIRVIHIETLPDGWKGKNHAMHTACEQATGEYLLFTDADCRQLSPHTLSVALQWMNDRGVGMLSLLPTLDIQSFWENIIQPVGTGVMMIWFEPAKVSNPDRPNAYANGAFILVRRDVYDRIGGHAAVKNDMQEDMELALRVKQQKLGLIVTRSAGLFSVRMYTSIGQIFRGWTRIFYGSFRTLRRLIISLVVMALMGLLPLAGMVVGLSAAGATDELRWWVCGLVGLGAIVMQFSLMFRFYKIIRVNEWLCWTYPLGCLMVAGMLVAAIFKHIPGAKIVWKGTTYPRR